jgi:hypothetical protein
MIVFGLIAFSIGLLMIIVALKDNSGEPGRVKAQSIVGIILFISQAIVRGGFFLN